MQKSRSSKSCETDAQIKAARQQSLRDLGKPTAQISVAEKQLVLLRPKEAARLIGFEAKTLANWRTSGKGPPFIKLEGRENKGPVRYERDSLLQWLKDRVRCSTGDAGNGEGRNE